MAVPFVDLGALHAPLEGELQAAIQSVIARNAFINGQEVRDLEAQCAEYLGVAHAIGVSSGTDALLAGLMALDIGPGDEVVTTPFTFFATAGSISRLGATPVFADIEPGSFNLDPDDVARRITSKTKAIVAVHLFGRSADLGRLQALADAHGLALIEDAAQAIGAEWDGVRAGALGDVGCFSFFPAKNLGCFGDGGLVTTQDDARAERLRAIRTHGGKRKYHHEEVGGNFRLDTIQAAVLSVKLPHLDAWTEARQANARRYAALLSGTGVAGPLDSDAPLVLPPAGSSRHVWNQYTVRVRGQRRDAVMQHLRSEGIGCAVYYPKALHQQPCFASLGVAEGSLPVSEQACREVLSLPVAPGTTEAQQREVVNAVVAALG